MKKITKTFVALFVVFVLVATMACAVACENDPCKDGHTASLVRGTAATCTEGGTQDYYKCAVCHKLFSDEACQNEIQDPIPTQALGHNTTGTWLFNDKQHYKFCDRCNKNVEAADHTAPDAEGKCAVCGKQLVAVKPADKGSLDDPYTVAQAVADCKQLASGEYSEGYYYVKGIVTSNPKFSSSNTTSAYSFSIKDALTGEDTLDAYYVYLDGQDVPYENDTVVIYGKLEFYSGYNGNVSYEITASQNDDPHASVKKVTRGESTITLAEVEGATVTGLQATQTVTNGQELSFQVEPLAGKKIVSVRVGNTTLSATEDNTYKFTVQGNATVTIVTDDEGAAVPQLLATVDFTSQSNYQANQDGTTNTITANGVTITHTKGTSSTFQDPTEATSHWRFHQNTTFKLEYTSEINYIILYCESDKATLGGQTVAGMTIEENSANHTITITLDDPGTTIDLGALGKQIRVDKIEVYGVVE